MDGRLPAKKEVEVRGVRRCIRIPQAAKESGLALGSIRKWVAQGLIPHFKVGRAVLIDADEFQEWLRRTRVEGR